MKPSFLSAEHLPAGSTPSLLSVHSLPTAILSQGSVPALWGCATSGLHAGSPLLAVIWLFPPTGCLLLSTFVQLTAKSPFRRITTTLYFSHLPSLASRGAQLIKQKKRLLCLFLFGRLVIRTELILSCLLFFHILSQPRTC